MGKMMKYLFVIGLMVCACSLAFGQGTIDKSKLIEMYKKGMFDNMSPSDIHQMLNQMGISESEALQYAKDNGIDLSKFIQGKGVTSGAVTPSATGVSIAVPETTKIGVQPLAAQPPPPAFPDTTKVTGAYGLEYFGYDIFKNIPSAFEPNAVGPIDPGYLVGPGDALMLSVWGQAEFQYELDVNSEGNVFIPNVGQVFVMGTPLRELEHKLRNQLSKYYSGLAATPSTVFMDVTIAKLRPLRVFVMGEVKHPGGYTISSYATVFNALYAVGGPLVRGSLRSVKVVRDKKVVAVVDLYDFLLRGDKTSDVRLQNDDLILVSPRGKTVSIRGEVRRPAIYELKEDENLSEFLDLCGGLLPTAYVGNAQIDRVKPFADRTKGIVDRIVVDVPLSDLLNKKIKDVVLYDGDETEVFSILEEKRNYVYAEGSVWRPGRYELDKIQTVRDLIAAAKGIQPKTYTDLAHISRLNDDRLTRSEISFDLKKVLDDAQSDIKLMPQDTVRIYSTEAIEVKDKYVNIYGEVKKPGRYLLQGNMTLADLILQAGGFTQEADILQAEVSRLRPGGIKGDSLVLILHPRLSNDFSRVLKNGGNHGGESDTALSSSEFILHHRDEVLVFPNPDYKIQQDVKVTGDVMFPGVYALKEKGERLSELIDRAGGVTKTSYLGGAQLHRGGRRMLLDFEKAYLKRDIVHDVILQRGDSIHVPSVPHTVLVSGEVNNPGLLSFVEGDNVMDYVNRAGGLTDSANYAVLTQPTGDSKRVNFGWFRANPEVADGASVVVYRTPPPPVQTGPGFDWGTTIKDTFAILTSGATLAYIVYQVTKK
jgi:protein involved in polysaccharide export with SLBB domain